MPHTARKRSSSGYYHAVPKGMSDHVIFSDDCDREFYTNLLGDAKSQTGILLVAYCIMSTHSHLIIDDPHGKISDFMKLVDERYASYVVAKTGRRGSVLRRPFWSEPIESEAHLLCAVRYVHANPAAAGICRASQYPWSSAKDYLGRQGITDTQLVLDMLGGVEGFITWSQPRNDTAAPFPGSRLTKHLGDDEAVRIASAVLGCHPMGLAEKPLEEQVEHITRLRVGGMPLAQIARVTGIQRRRIEWLVRLR